MLAKCFREGESPRHFSFWCDQSITRRSVNDDRDTDGAGVPRDARKEEKAAGDRVTDWSFRQPPLRFAPFATFG